jgi:hypothetical protein
MLVQDVKLDAVLYANCCPKSSQDAAVLKIVKTLLFLAALKVIEDTEKNQLHKN